MQMEEYKDNKKEAVEPVPETAVVVVDGKGMVKVNPSIALSTLRLILQRALNEVNDKICISYISLVQEENKSKLILPK